MIGKGALAGLLLQLGGFIAGAAECQKSDDVGFWKRRFGAIVEVQAAIGGSADGDAEIVITDVGGGLEIELRLDGDGIGEGNVAAFEGEVSAVKGGLTFEDIDAAQESGACDGAAQAEVGVTGEAGDGGAHLEFRRGLHMDVEFDVVERRVGDRQRGALPATLEI